MKLNSFDSAKQTAQTQLEVGASQNVLPSSFISTSVSLQNSKVTDKTIDPCASNHSNRYSSSSEAGSYHFPSLSMASERPSQLSPLTECVENGESNSLRRSSGLENFSETLPMPPSDNFNYPNDRSPTRSVVCDGQQQPCSDSSSPSVGVGATDFMGTEYYMDESLPSSLSEHPVGGHHQAIVSLLQVLDDSYLVKRFHSRNRSLKNHRRYVPSCLSRYQSLSSLSFSFFTHLRLHLVMPFCL